jgi:hypothetical protein
MLPLLYGEEICAALDYDVMLRDAYRNGVITHVVSAYPPTEGEKETYRKFMYLKTSGYIDYAQQPNTFRITESGKIFLSRGGFTGEVKKSKHAIMAFTISLISLLIAAMSFLFHFLCRE